MNDGKIKKIRIGHDANCSAEAYLASFLVGAFGYSLLTLIQISLVIIIKTFSNAVRKVQVMSLLWVVPQAFALIVLLVWSYTSGAINYGCVIGIVPWAIMIFIAIVVGNNSIAKQEQEELRPGIWKTTGIALLVVLAISLVLGGSYYLAKEKGIWNFIVTQPEGCMVPLSPFEPKPAQVNTDTGNIEIIDIFYLENKDAPEYVEIRNDDTRPIQLHSWTLTDKAYHPFEFPEYYIKPGETCRIYTNNDSQESCCFNYRVAIKGIWDNDGDCATLMDPQKNVVAEKCY